MLDHLHYSLHSYLMNLWIGLSLLALEIAIHDYLCVILENKFY